MTIAAYVLTVGLAAFGIVSAPAPLVSGLLARVAGGSALNVGLLVGSVLGWSILSLLWQVVEGGPIPLAALGLSFVAIGAHGTMSWDELNSPAKHTLVAEMWAIAILAIILAADSGAVRWY